MFRGFKFSAGFKKGLCSCKLTSVWRYVVSPQLVYILRQTRNSQVSLQFPPKIEYPPKMRKWPFSQNRGYAAKIRRILAEKPISSIFKNRMKIDDFSSESSNFWKSEIFRFSENFLKSDFWPEISENFWQSPKLQQGTGDFLTQTAPEIFDFRRGIKFHFLKKWSLFLQAKQVAASKGPKTFLGPPKTRCYSKHPQNCIPVSFWPIFGPKMIPKSHFLPIFETKSVCLSRISWKNTAQEPVIP